MILSNHDYNITIEQDKHYTVNSADNKKYDYVFNPSNYTKKDFTKTLSVTVDSEIKQTTFALIGSGFSCCENCAVLDGHNLILMQNRDFIMIDLQSNTILQHKTLDVTDCLYEVHQYQKDYIVYGELSVYRLSSNFDIVWRFSGADIFVSPNSERCFVLDDENIVLSDWNNNRYILDYDGNLIE